MSLYHTKTVKREKKVDISGDAKEKVSEVNPFPPNYFSSTSTNTEPSFEEQLRKTYLSMDSNGFISPTPWTTVKEVMKAKAPRYTSDSDLDEDLLKSPSDSNYDEKNSDEDEDGDGRPIITKDKKAYFKDLYTQYKKTSDINILVNLLFKSRIIRQTSSCINFNRIELRGKNKPQDYIHNKAVRESENFLYELEQYGSHNPEVFEDLVRIATSLYEGGYEKNFYMFLYDADSYKRLLQLCLDKGVKYDEDFKNLKDINFKELRSHDNCVTLFYSTIFDSIITLDTKTRSYRNERLLSFYDLLESKPSIEGTKVNNNKEIIILNGKEYPKHIFESLIETDLDVFLFNMEIEMIIDNSKNIAESVVENVSELNLL